MRRFSSIFSQILQLFSRHEFESAVKQHRSHYATKGFCGFTSFILLFIVKE